MRLELTAAEAKALSDLLARPRFSSPQNLLGSIEIKLHHAWATAPIQTWSDDSPGTLEKE